MSEGANIKDQSGHFHWVLFSLIGRMHQIKTTVKRGFILHMVEQDWFDNQLNLIHSQLTQSLESAKVKLSKICTIHTKKRLPRPSFCSMPNPLYFYMFHLYITCEVGMGLHTGGVPCEKICCICHFTVCFLRPRE